VFDSWSSAEEAVKLPPQHSGSSGMALVDIFVVLFVHTWAPLYDTGLLLGAVGEAGGLRSGLHLLQ